MEDMHTFGTEFGGWPARAASRHWEISRIETCLLPRMTVLLTDDATHLIYG